uniref:hydroxyethylthiazole kinase n=1 Tax=Globodera rostochiensis TaxID=31243 RepID=A0A914H3P4_GLORO
MCYTPRHIYALLSELRCRAPLVHCLTNQVVSNFTANVLLALGAVPAMKCAIQIAVRSAVESGRPWVLDPVAVGHTLPFRSQFAVELIREWHPTAIRANASEVMALDGMLRRAVDDVEYGMPADVGGVRGPNSKVESSAAVEHAKNLALFSESLVAMTGQQDFIADHCSNAIIKLHNGHPLMAKVTGIGCALSASLAAFLAVAKSADDRRLACLTALAVTAVAGELAAEESRGPGTFAVAYLDKLANLSEADLERLQISWMGG